MELSLERTIENSCYTKLSLASVLGISLKELYSKLNGEIPWEKREQEILILRLHIPQRYIRDYFG